MKDPHEAVVLSVIEKLQARLLKHLILNNMMSHSDVNFIALCMNSAIHPSLVLLTLHIHTRSHTHTLMAMLQEWSENHQYEARLHQTNIGLYQQNLLMVDSAVHRFSIFII